MIAVFAFVRLGPFRHLSQAVARGGWQAGAHALAVVRAGVATHLVLGR